MIWKARNITLTFDRPMIMGVLNLTPDSFSDGGHFMGLNATLDRIFLLIEEGVDIIDIGAESTRPGANPVSEEEELERLLPVLQQLRGRVQVPISVDTMKSRVAREALQLGVHIINDVSGLRYDPELAHAVRDFRAGLVLMHRRGTAQTMQLMTRYHDLVGDIVHELSESVFIAQSCGVEPDYIAVDPGIGFSKTAEQNLELLNQLDEFKELGRPILVGPSRKSFIGAVTKAPADKRLFGTIAASVLAFERGANMLRVHDVAAVKEAILVADAILNTKVGFLHESR